MGKIFEFLPSEWKSSIEFFEYIPQSKENGGTTFRNDVDWLKALVMNEIEGGVFLKEKFILRTEVFFELETDMTMFVMRAEQRKLRYR